MFEKMFSLSKVSLLAALFLSPVFVVAYGQQKLQFLNENHRYDAPKPQTPSISQPARDTSPPR